MIGCDVWSRGACPADSERVSETRRATASISVGRRALREQTSGMNDSNMEQMGPQNYLYGCVGSLEEDDHFHVVTDTVCVDPTTKDELHIVEVEGQDKDGQTVKAVLATLKPSTLPSVSLGGFEITPPAVFRLRSGSGPIHISGQHLVLIDGDESFESEEEDDDEEEEEVVKAPLKRPAAAITPKSQVGIHILEDEDDEESEEEEEEETPVKPKKTPVKVQTPAQNGKTSSAPAGKPAAKAKTPDTKGKDTKPQTPRTPRPALTLEDVKAKLIASVEKGLNMPKIQTKFENYVKHSFRMLDPKDTTELWKWRQTVQDKNCQLSHSEWGGLISAGGGASCSS
ncbi:Nucleophosmin-like [Arapaima gigas]